MPSFGQKLKARYGLILHPNIPKPLHGTAPRTLLGTTWWDGARRDAYRKAQRRCMCCGELVTKDALYPRLEAHECYSVDYDRCRLTFTEVVALCHWCHMGIHTGLASVLHTTRQMPNAEYKRIMAHRERILAKWAKDAVGDPSVATVGDPNRCPCAWSQWHLMIGEDRFEGQWESFDHWKAHYAQMKGPMPELPGVVPLDLPFDRWYDDEEGWGLED